MMNYAEIIYRIKQVVDQAGSILIITHQKPDGDGLGAISALAFYLTSQRKNYQLFCKDSVPETSQFLPLIYQVTSDQSVFEKKFEVIILLDSGDLEYAGVEQIIKGLNYKFILINIDHHITNRGYGDLNLVLPEKSSTSEIIYGLFRHWQFPLSKEVATALLNGIIFDTGAFSNAATSLSALEIASHLLNMGARHKEINEYQLKNKSLGLLKLWGRAFERLTFNEKYNLAFTVITQKDILECQAPDEATEGIANFLNELSGAKVVMVLKESQNGIIRGSFRTTYDDVDVGEMAKRLGGGGHRKASGFSIIGKLVYANNRWIIESI